jgi:cytochrome bd-type quinol oxidase subunit 2
MKTFMVMMLVAVLMALAGAGLFMLRKGGSGADRQHRMARALAVRVGLSVTLFLVVLLGWHLGWIRPSGLPLGQ